jgi:hypothetical protein
VPDTDLQISRLGRALGLLGRAARKIAADAWGAAVAEHPGRYRPEAHYMRGPGPKWRAKHATAAVPTQHGSLRKAGSAR